MDSERIEAAASLLAEARREHRVIPEIPDDCRPRNLAEAYAVRDRVVALHGRPTGGWFCAATNQVIQDMMALEEPYYAYLIADHILPSPARLRVADHPPMVLECEFAFRVDRDLPPRDEPYSRAEVEEAVATVHPAIEVVAGHLENWPVQDIFSVIADNGTDGALVHGEGVAEWRDLDLVNMAVSLMLNGARVRGGRGMSVFGDPFESFVWLVNALSRDGHGLEEGAICNTGTVTEICWISPGDEARAEFEGLGSVTLEVVD